MATLYHHLVFLLAASRYYCYPSCVDLNSTTPPTDEALRQLVDGCTKFGLALLQSITTQSLNDEAGGILISPYGIWSALLITYIGSATDTQAELGKTLRLGKLTKLQVAELRSLLIRDHPSYLMVSRLYLQRGLTLATCTRKTSGSDVGYADFRNDPEGARRTINNWVEAVTENKIRSLLPPSSLGAYTRMVLANAVYFQSLWTIPFNASKTRYRNFTVSLSEQVQVQMMSITGRYMYATFQDSQFSVIQLPYGERGDVVMLILLPDHRFFGLKMLDQIISGEHLRRLRRRLRYKEVCVELPKFKLERSYQLVEPLRNMGVRTLFNQGEADLTDLVVGRRGYLAVDKVQHRSAIDVSENGTLSVAATTIHYDARSGPPQWPILFTVDHPFFFLILDTVTDVALFMGTVWRPMY
uniref:Putative Protease inhibitor n=1 Tax=Megacormus gertschi TaxID=1843536 RepID=A0A224XGN6_9SCOR